MLLKVPEMEPLQSERSVKHLFVQRQKEMAHLVPTKVVYSQSQQPPCAQYPVPKPPNPPNPSHPILLVQNLHVSPQCSAPIDIIMMKSDNLKSVICMG